MKIFFSDFFNNVHVFFQTQSFPTRDEWLNLFSWSYWSNPQPPSDSNLYIFVGVLVALVVAGLITWTVILRRRNKKTSIYEGLISHLVNLITLIVLIYFAYLFFRLQEIAYLSSQLVILGTIIVVFLWSLLILKILIWEIPQKKRTYLEKERFLRYLPNSRKKE